MIESELRVNMESVRSIITTDSGKRKSVLCLFKILSPHISSPAACNLPQPRT
jgi:hypothetical protein